MALWRRRAGRCTRTAACVVLATLLWLHLHLQVARPASSAEGGGPPPGAEAPSPGHRGAAELTSTTSPRARAQRGSTSQPGIADIRRSLERYNEAQAVLNEDVFGPVRNDTLVIVVQVHRRMAYLRHLIHSLAQARDIDQVLLVFSHDFYDEEMNELVQSVDFCKVMQIFYPHSIQTHPHEFPGESSDDCPRNIKKKAAIQSQCVNAMHPDSYGHYREAKFTQIKHHWWWKANWVFNKLTVTHNHEGLVLFLEEDHYVAEDFIHILRLMQLTCRTSCPRCNILSLGTYQKKFDFSKESNKTVVAQWTGNKHNMGMALNGSTWRAVQKCAHVFCTYDDYNWDWSLQFSAQQCLRSDLVTLMMKQPRVFHLGECGLHHGKANCEPRAALSAVQWLLQAARQHLYPPALAVTAPRASRKKLVKSNGGWGDVRDHQLCLNMTLPAR
ncbi:alpha-1,6-mannosyl-glycoprotein 2-beta-N-acetylglucosaminyltransferase-like [Bacillus rossius redtenbacheri]|uniref:alpha-1,6-mannosyl-glycoprotein 2-beta-N-acetylglucosaminyltransferase-like n=1 Tax=Bacillus rossius redtenbacheri TaxID=93214 RepID=UPI002FDD352B